MATHLDLVAWKRKVRIRTIVLIVAAVLLIGGAVTLYLLRGRIIPAMRYAQAESAEASGDTQMAIDTFALLGTYRDANARAAALAFGLQDDGTLENEFRSAAIGDVVTFGSYEQDNSTAEPEPIRWFVLAKENDRLLLWSESALDCKRYHTSVGDVTWADCSLRAWLNGEFSETAFTPQERALIAKTKLENPDNGASFMKGGKDTEDSVFIISFNELLQYGVENPHLEGIWAMPTKYAIANGLEAHKEYGTCMWWLRTPGISQDSVSYCDMNGMPLYSAVASKRALGVRPLVWVFAGSEG